MRSAASATWRCLMHRNWFFRCLLTGEEECGIDACHDYDTSHVVVASRCLFITDFSSPRQTCRRVCLFHTDRCITCRKTGRKVLCVSSGCISFSTSLLPITSLLRCSSQVSLAVAHTRATHARYPSSDTPYSPQSFTTNSLHTLICHRHSFDSLTIILGHYHFITSAHRHESRHVQHFVLVVEVLDLGP